MAEQIHKKTCFGQRFANIGPSRGRRSVDEANEASSKLARLFVHPTYGMGAAFKN
jgi:hypothetical protein